MSFKQNYFSALVSSPQPFAPGARIANVLPADDTTYVMGYEAKLPYEGQPLHFYFGPNDLAELEVTGLDEVGRIIDYGWWIFGWVNRNIILPIYGFVAQYVGNLGLIVLILTLFAMPPVVLYIITVAKPADRTLKLHTLPRSSP